MTTRGGAAMATMHGMEQYARLGLISREEALGKQIKKSALDFRLVDGSLIPMYRGIYRFRGAPESWKTRALGLTMYAGKGSAISHQSAAYLHGLDGFDEEPSTHDLLLPIRLKASPPGARVHRTREGFQIFNVDGLIPTTSVARTLVDLAAVVSPLELETALNSARRGRPTMGRWLKHTIAKLKRTNWRGVDLLREMVERMLSNRLDSAFEVEVSRKLQEARLPPFETQFVVRDRFGNYVMRVDFCWKDHLVVLHVDGYAFHSSERAMARDARQRSQLSLLDWTQITVMPKTLADGLWLEQLREALSRPVRATSPSEASPRAR